MCSHTPFPRRCGCDSVEWKFKGLDGVWHGGVWHGGVWHGGVWHGGVWHGGVWHGGVWYRGVWLSPTGSAHLHLPQLRQFNGHTMRDSNIAAHFSAPFPSSSSASSSPSSSPSSPSPSSLHQLHYHHWYFPCLDNVSNFRNSKFIFLLSRFCFVITFMGGQLARGNIVGGCCLVGGQGLSGG